MRDLDYQCGYPRVLIIPFRAEGSAVGRDRHDSSSPLVRIRGLQGRLAVSGVTRACPADDPAPSRGDLLTPGQRPSTDATQSCRRRQLPRNRDLEEGERQGNEFGDRITWMLNPGSDIRDGGGGGARGVDNNANLVMSAMVYVRKSVLCDVNHA